MTSGLRLPKSAFDLGAIHSMIRDPNVLGPMLSTQPGLVGGLASATGGVGLMGALDLIRHGGSNFGSLMKGPLSGRTPGGPLAGPVAAMQPLPHPQPKTAPTGPPITPWGSAAPGHPPAITPWGSKV